MTYKKKLLILSVLASLLVLIYILSFIVDSKNPKDASFAWINPSIVELADRIEMYGSAGRIVLQRKNGVWLFPAVTMDYPVKQNRVEDLLGLLSRKSAYTKRSVSAQGRERLSLDEGNASRIVLRGGAGLPLLDLLVGSSDVFLRDVYIKRADKNEVYSGEDYFTYYTESRIESWYDLRFFPSSTASIADFQQIDVHFQDDAYTLRRSGRAWIIPADESAELDTVRVESWLRSVVEGEGEDFASMPPDQIEGRLTLWQGNGEALILHIAHIDEEGRRALLVSGSPLVYLVSDWSFDRLFRDISYFVITGTERFSNAF